MPTYEYKCLSCGIKFEEFQRMTDEPLTECPKCGGPVKRLIGAGLSPIFKGSGFYETDYKKKGNGNSTSRESDSKETKSKTPQKS